MTEKLPTFFGYRHYGCDVYDVKISKKSDVDYGKFHTKKALLPWLYENVFKYGYGFKTLAETTFGEGTINSIFNLNTKTRKGNKIMANFNIEIYELFGAMVNMGGDPYMIETEEQAESLKESIERATIEREITDEDEFKTATQQLDLYGHDPERIWSFVDGSEFLVCLSGDWY